MKLSRVALIAALVAASTLWAVPAYADGVSSVSGTSLYFTAGMGERNVLTIRQALDVYIINDIWPIEAGAGCYHETTNMNQVICSMDLVDWVIIDVKDRDDYVDYNGPDNSYIYGGDGPDDLNGGSGRDFFYPGNGDDSAHGRGGDDKFLWSPGADRMFGGVGRDRVSYADAPGPINADLDGAANDGALGEADMIFTDVENLEGSRFGDVLIGNDLYNDLNGNGGSDILFGHGGDDLLYGDRFSPNGLAADAFSGGDGVDTVSYADHTAEQPVTADLDNATGDDGALSEGDIILADVENLIGSEGSDILVGNAGSNQIHGGGGNDWIGGLDSVDHLWGEAGSDSLFGGDDIDILEGGDGNDSLFGQRGADGLYGGPGTDTCDESDEDVVADSC